MSTPELSAESDQVHARLLKFVLAAVVVTHLLLVLSIWGQWRTIAIITTAFFGVVGYNLVLARPVFAAHTRLAEGLRLVGNTLANIVHGHFTGWSLPV